MTQASMKKGLESLFNPKEEFKNEASLGKKILYVAWTVEILAALIGFTIAVAIAYDAFYLIENPNRSHLIGAIIGALPFVIIAVIEPTKIPLAAGFYKTRILGWKILILISLLGLTVVTFETMFNGLERNLTNVTRAVVVSDNNILKFSDQVHEKQRTLDELRNKSEKIETANLQSNLQELQNNFDKESATLISEHRERLQKPQENKFNLEKQLAALTGDAGKSTEQQSQTLRQEIEISQKQISSLEKARDKELNDYKESVEIIQKQQTGSSAQRLSIIRDQKNKKTQEIKTLSSEIDTQRKEEIRGLSLSQKTFDDVLKRLSLDEETARKGAGFFGGGRVDERFAQRRKSAEDSFAETQKRIKQNTKDGISTSEARVALLLKEVALLDSNISSAVAESNVGIKYVDQTKIDQINRSYTKRINKQIQKIDGAQNDITDITKAQSGVTLRDRDRLQAEIKFLEKQIQVIAEKQNSELEKRRRTYSSRLEDIGKEKQDLLLRINSEKKDIPNIENAIKDLKGKIDKAKDQKRNASQESQVYRLAALAYGKTDVADVNREEIRTVSIVWFGSIALIVSTIGTVLALISQILQDPEAFVERKKISLTSRISRLSYIIFWRVNKLLLSAINVFVAMMRLILSFAEIFRGLVGTPVQRAIRRFLLSYRRRLNKPKILEVIKEVEKIVEKEVEKIVEVEKIIEKIVNVEVPVEKIAIKEVPVEIIRKELVYVPLYSTESGLIDASTELKGAKPKIDDLPREENLNTAHEVDPEPAPEADPKPTPEADPGTTPEADLETTPAADSETTPDAEAELEDGEEKETQPSTDNKKNTL